MALGEPKAMADTQRDQAAAAQKAIQTRILHEGREGVERTVPVVERPKRGRKAKSTTPPLPFTAPV